MTASIHALPVRLTSSSVVGHMVEGGVVLPFRQRAARSSIEAALRSEKVARADLERTANTLAKARDRRAPDAEIRALSHLNDQALFADAVAFALAVGARFQAAGAA